MYSSTKRVKGAVTGGKQNPRSPTHLQHTYDTYTRMIRTPISFLDGHKPVHRLQNSDLQQILMVLLIVMQHHHLAPQILPASPGPSPAPLPAYASTTETLPVKSAARAPCKPPAGVFGSDGGVFARGTGARWALQAVEHEGYQVGQKFLERSSSDLFWICKKKRKKKKQKRPRFAPKQVLYHTSIHVRVCLVSGVWLYLNVSVCVYVGNVRITVRRWATTAVIRIDYSCR